jgi:hypothetical protein
MKHESQFNNEEQQNSTARQQSEKEAVIEFPSAEAMLRHDALHTTVPPRIAQRLQETIGALPPAAARPWWRRAFRG